MLNSWITCVVGSIRPTAEGLPLSLNHIPPSEPVSMICGTLPGFRPALNSCTACVVGLIIPIAFGVPWSVNQTLPSGPVRTLFGLLVGLSANSLICPMGVMNPIAFVVPWSTNHMFPSGPDCSRPGLLPGFSPVLNSVIVPSVVMRPIALVVPRSLNHMFPSGPSLPMRNSELPAFSPAEYSVITPAGVIFPTLCVSRNQMFPSGPALPITVDALSPAVNFVTCPRGAAPPIPAPQTSSAPSSAARATRRFEPGIACGAPGKRVRVFIGISSPCDWSMRSSVGRAGALSLRGVP